MSRFKQEVLDRIKSDVDLFAAVCKALEISPASMPETLKRNGRTLNQYSIVTLVADRLGLKPEEVVEDSEPVSKGKATNVLSRCQ